MGVVVESWLLWVKLPRWPLTFNYVNFQFPRLLETGYLLVMAAKSILVLILLGDFECCDRHTEGSADKQSSRLLSMDEWKGGWIHKRARTVVFGI